MNNEMWETILKVLAEENEKMPKRIITKEIKNINDEIDNLKIKNAISVMQDEIDTDEDCQAEYMDNIREKILEGIEITDEDRSAMNMLQGHKEGLIRAIEILEEYFPRIK